MDVKPKPRHLGLSLLLFGLFGLAYVAWATFYGARDLERAQLLEDSLEAEIARVVEKERDAAGRVSAMEGADAAALEALQARVDAAEGAEAQVAAASRLAAGLSQQLRGLPAPMDDAEREARAALQFEVLRAQEALLERQAQLQEARALHEQAAQTTQGKLARGLGLAD